MTWESLNRSKELPCLLAKRNESKWLDKRIVEVTKVTGAITGR